MYGNRARFCCKQAEFCRQEAEKAVSPSCEWLRNGSSWRSQPIGLSGAHRTKAGLHLAYVIDPASPLPHALFGSSRINICRAHSA